MTGFYYLLWTFYLLTVSLIGFGFWCLIRHFKVPLLRDLLLGLLLALLMTPWRVVPDQNDLAPALVIAILEGGAGGVQGAWRGLMPIIGACGAVVVLLIGLKVVGLTGRDKNKGHGRLESKKAKGSLIGKSELELSMPPGKGGCGPIKS